MAALPPTEEGARTELAGDDPTQEQPAHRAPDKSTMGLASSSQPTGAPARIEGEVAGLEIGETLAGRFTVLRFIARGGMGAVYEASDALLRTRVALKVIGDRLAGDATALERFRRAVLLARRVSHPNVCRVYELSEARTANGIPLHFLTMELLEGESLARRLARSGRMTTEEALPVAKQLCAGLQAAHAEGVIHRDFKSSNVLLVSRTGSEGEQTGARVVITDFGVARAMTLTRDEAAGEGPLTGQAILGTTEYMAPEQMTRAGVTAAADIYALGVVLHEMVTGKLPFSAATGLVSAARRLNEAPPRPETMVPGLDKRWAAAIVRCLAPQPERRFQSAREVLGALDRPARRRGRTVPLAIAALALLIAAYGIVKYGPSFRLRLAERKAAVSTPRPKVAILGIRNELGSGKLPWLRTAVTELGAHEVAAAESSLRLIGTDAVDLAQRSLGVSSDDIEDPKTQTRLQALLDADVLVHGSLFTDPVETETVRLRLQVLDAESRRNLGILETDLGPEGARLTEVLPDLGTKLRGFLRAPLSSEEETALLASRAHNLDAAKTYAEGVMRSQRWDLEEARGYFAAAIESDPDFLQARGRLAATWFGPGKRVEVWKGIRARPGGLTARQAAVIDLRIEPDADKRVALFEARPDDLGVGLDLALRSPPRAGVQLIKRLQQLRAGQPLNLAIQEAFAAKQGGETEHASKLLERVGARATELGARWELARVREIQGDILYGDPSRFRDALARYQEAARLYTEVGDLFLLAELKSGMWNLLRDMGLKRETLQVLDEASALYRRLGNRGEMAGQLSFASTTLTLFGDLDAARKKLSEARRELEALGVPLDSRAFMFYSTSAFQLAMAEADLDAAREALTRVLRHPFAQQRGWGEGAEVMLLYELDQFEQARASLAKANALARPGESVSFPPAATCSFDCDGDEPAAGLACLEQRCRAEQPGLNGLQKSGCPLEEARCSFRAGDLGRAEQAAREAWAAHERSDEYVPRLRSHAILLRITAARGDSARSLRLLRADLAEVESKGHKQLAFEIALALGDAELRTGRPEGRARLARLEREAKSREFFRIARLALEAMDQKPTAAAARSH